MGRLRVPRRWAWGRRLLSFRCVSLAAGVGVSLAGAFFFSAACVSLVGGLVAVVCPSRQLPCGLPACPSWAVSGFETKSWLRVPRSRRWRVPRRRPAC